MNPNVNLLNEPVFFQGPNARIPIISLLVAEVFIHRGSMLSYYTPQNPQLAPQPASRPLKLLQTPGPNMGVSENRGPS